MWWRSAKARRLLGSPTSPKVMLLTLLPSPRYVADEHPALLPGAVRFSTRIGTVVDSSIGMIPFHPLLAAWPTVNYRLSRTERRAEIPRVRLDVLGTAALPQDIGTSGPVSGWTARLDLWTPGLTLAEAVPLLMGPVTDASRDRARGLVTLNATDGDPLSDASLGGEAITAEDFPDAPDLVLDRARRQLIVGSIPDPIPCIQISHDGTHWYFMDRPTAIPPDRFWIGSEPAPLRDRPEVRFTPFPSDPARRYTELVFPRPVSESLQLGGVSAAGGVGLDADPVTLLLQDVGGYRLSPQAVRDLATLRTSFNFSVFINAQTTVLQMVRDRLLPQTDLVMTFSMGRVHTYRLTPTYEPSRLLGPGMGLRDRLLQPHSPNIESVYNAIEVRYRRTTLPPTGDLLTRSALLIDRYSGGPMGAICAMSEQRYGRRFLSVEAADLVDEQGLPPGNHPASVWRLGETLVRLHALPHRPVRYLSTWATALDVQPDTPCQLTDPAAELNATPARVVDIAFPPSGPELMFETEDAR